MAAVQDLSSFVDREIVCGDCSFVLITEADLADSCFLLGHLVTRHLVAGHSVCLVSTSRTNHHYRHLGSKLGVHFRSFEDKGQLLMIEGLKLELDFMRKTWETNVETSACPLLGLGVVYERVKEAVDLWTGRPFFVVVDDVSLWIRVGWAAREVIAFVQGCRTLTCVPHGRLGLVIGERMDDQNVPRSDLSLLLAHWCDLKMTVAHLTTGHSTDVHGQLGVTWRNRALKSGGKVATTDYHYKVEEKRVLIFAPGTSAAVL